MSRKVAPKFSIGILGKSIYSSVSLNSAHSRHQLIVISSKVYIPRAEKHTLCPPSKLWSRHFKKQALPHANALSWEPLHFNFPKSLQAQTSLIVGLRCQSEIPPTGLPWADPGIRILSNPLCKTPLQHFSNLGVIMKNNYNNKNKTKQNRGFIDR